MSANESSQAKVVNLSQFKLEKHVAESFRTAWALSEQHPINARYALMAALFVSKSADSPAFSKFASLFPPAFLDRIWAKPPSRIEPWEMSFEEGSFPFDFPLAEAYSVAETFLKDGKGVWGRDYITLALLAVSDPSLRTIAEDAGLSLEELQDEWYRFVTSDTQQRRDSESWTEWWHMAGVPLPDERVQRFPLNETGQETSRGTYLLTWDPTRYAVDIMDPIRKVEYQGVAVMRWSVGNHGLMRGDRVFFMRHGKDMPGLIGAGYVVSDVEEGRHWDETKPNWTSYYGYVRWDVLRQSPLIPLEELIKQTGEDKLWTTEGSGLAIPQAVADRLEILWKELLATKPEPTLGQGPSTHIATDIWTLDDALGYQAYAYAIYRFMTHPQTKPPLTISIQAPWGGGKTSLMRMVQRLLDPEALKNLRIEPGQPHADFTIKDALDEIHHWTRSGTRKDLPRLPEDEPRRRLTVWFNAWKYESTNQVWAGLADAIMKQVAARLTLAKKERFWLRLNLRRVDAEKIRHSIYERILNYFWRSARGWLLTFGLLLLASMPVTVIGWLTKQSIAQNVGWGCMGSSVLLSIILSVEKYLAAKRNVEKEPASVSLREYLDIPDYNKELGFVHHVEVDLHRVLASVPEQRRPIVIFIDDLDRCSPAKVAQVLEAVNLFLAGDFPHCIFLLGMDSEMVAAALQAAHKDMLACLPADAGIPLGWRFMDKFVQLPFLIPPSEDTDLKRYTKSLFPSDEDLTLEPVMQHALETAPNIPSKSAVADEMATLQTKHNLNEVQRNYLQEQLEAQVVKRVLDKGIATFTDKNPEIQRVISTATLYFYGNPRELKRFVNVFRFHYFVWWARKAQELETPTLDQLVRWTVLSMKWPEIVRWLRRGGGTDWCVQSDGGEPSGCFPSQTSRLKLIESISGKATDLKIWQEQALQVLRLTTQDAPWLKEAQLLHFFRLEYTQYPEGQRLSDGEGKGLW